MTVLKMKKNNMVDLTQYRDQQCMTAPMSHELQVAIQNLIHRLRELGPLTTN